jgi:hypothetical protein
MTACTSIKDLPEEERILLAEARPGVLVGEGRVAFVTVR